MGSTVAFASLMSNHIICDLPGSLLIDQKFVRMQACMVSSYIKSHLPVMDCWPVSPARLNTHHLLRVCWQSIDGKIKFYEVVGICCLDGLEQLAIWCKECHQSLDVCILAALGTFMPLSITVISC